MSRNTGYVLSETRVVRLVWQVRRGELALSPDCDDVTALDASAMITAMLAGRPIGVFVARRPGIFGSATVVGGGRSLAALVRAFQSPADGGLSVDLTSDSPAVVADPHGQEALALPLATAMETVPYLRWRRAVVAESAPSEQVLDRMDEVANQVAGYSVPVLWLPSAMDLAVARAAFQHVDLWAREG